MVFLKMATLKILPYKPAQTKAELINLEIRRQQVEERPRQFQRMQVEDDQIYMKLQTYTIQFSDKKGMAFLPVKIK